MGPFQKTQDPSQSLIQGSRLWTSLNRFSHEYVVANPEATGKDERWGMHRKVQGDINRVATMKSEVGDIPKRKTEAAKRCIYCNSASYRGEDKRGSTVKCDRKADY